MKRYIKASSNHKLTYADLSSYGLDDNLIRNILYHFSDLSLQSIQKYLDPKYNWSQIFRILSGLAYGVDVSWYDDPKFDGNRCFKFIGG